MITPQEIIVLIRAYIDGKEIESQFKEDNHQLWCEVNIQPMYWDFNNYNYRIKPEPRIIYMNKYPDGSIGKKYGISLGFCYKTVNDAKASAASTCIGQAKFIEVLK
jgi:hypothetical protein